LIISHSRKFIFIKTSKTAGTSLEMALSKYCDEQDVIARLVPKEEKQRRSIAGLGARNDLKPLSELGPLELMRYMLLRKRERVFLEHSTASYVRGKVSDDIWNNYFKFGVMRHPFDRMISYYHYAKNFEIENSRPQLWDHNDFDQYLRYRTADLTENWRQLTARDRVLVDFVARFETLETDLAEVSRRIGLDHNIYEDMRAIRAKGGIRPEGASVKRSLTERQRDLIARVCAKEMETFGYTREAPVS